jgi:hypothetical protein
VSATRAVGYPYELDYGEGIVLWQAAHVTDLDTAFHPVQRYPYLVFHYPPLYHLITRTVAVAIGNLLAAGRLVSVLSGIALALMVGGFAWAVPKQFDRGSRFMAAAFAAMVCLSSPLMSWTFLMRVDTTAVAFTFAGAYVFLVAGFESRWQFASCICFAAALLSKQSMLAAPAACVAVAFLVKPRRAVGLTALTGAAVIAAYTLLIWRTHGQAALHLFRYNVNAFSLMKIFTGFYLYLSPMLGGIAIALGAAASFMFRSLRRPGARFLGGLRRDLSNSPYRRAVCTLGLHLLLTLSMVAGYGKYGSAYNYFLETQIAAVACCGLVLAGILWAWRRNMRTTMPAGVALAAIGVLAVQCAPEAVLRTDKRFLPVWGAYLPYQAMAMRSRVVLEEIRNTPGLVLSEDMLLSLKAGKELPAEFAIIKALSDVGAWDDSEFLQMIRSHRFGLIVLRAKVPYDENLTDRVQSAIAEAYQLADDGNTYVTYRPRAK